MLNKDLTQAEAKFLVEEYAPRMGGRISGETMGKYFVPARTLMQGKPSETPGCSCMYKSYVMMTNSMYGQYQEEIKAIAYPVIKTSRGRKKVQHVSTDTPNE